MTILPNNKRNNNSNGKENEKNETNNTQQINHNTQQRLNRGLLSSSQLLIQDTAPVGSPLQNHTSYSEDISKFRPSHVGHLLGNTFKEEQGPASPGGGRRTYSRERASKRKSREHLDHDAKPKTNQPPSSAQYHTQSNEADSERNNSEDEYEPAKISNEEWEDRDRTFNETMRKKGFVVKNIVEDGACLFRAIADQVYGNEDMHSIVRNNCMDYIMQNRDFFSEYITEDINRYVSRKRNDFVHGNHLEIQALSELYNRTIEVYCYTEAPINIFHGNYKHDYEPIRLSYQRGSHYNSIVDPYCASVGVGLGLPNYQPGEAERNLLKDASNASELTLIEQTMIQDKLAATDWEATNDAILEQATRESWALYVNDGHLRDPLAGCSSTSGNSSTHSNSSTCRSLRSNSFTTRMQMHASSSHTSQRVSTTVNKRIPTPPQRIPSPSTNSRLTPTPPLRGHRMSTPPHQSGSSRSCHSLPTSPHSSPRVHQQSNAQSSLCPSWPSSPRLHVSQSTPNSPHGSPRQSTVHSKDMSTTTSPGSSGDLNIEGLKTDGGPIDTWEYPQLFSPASPDTKDENIVMQMNPEIFGMSGWGDDAGIIAKVLAESQKEYLDSLKAARQTQHQSSTSTSGTSTSSSFDPYDDARPGPSSKT
ncbi:OTU domain-containing protein 5 [Chrysoperla carnea]|uniref:OTU domain-containing protein 5 n=1 Tax=Chrysoperla carnea TaxID=189513 RepID=UPI001D0714FF|nr:OTU domain-containing protein 5 [Chrysoperla carnea]